MVTKRQTHSQILTVNPSGLFIDGKPTKTYNGELIEKVADFAKVLGKDFIEVQIMQSDTPANYAESGTPEPDDLGLYTWVRVKVQGGKDGIWSDWLRNTEYTGYPTVAQEPFQSTQDQARKRLQGNILTDTFVLHSTKRKELRNALQKNLEPKLAEWKSSKELTSYIVSPFDALDKSEEFLKKKLKDFASKYPDAVAIVKDAQDARYVNYWLDRKFMKKFCKYSGLHMVLPLKTKDWKNAADLAKGGIKEKEKNINKALEQLIDAITKQLQTSPEPDIEMLDWVQLMLNPETFEPEYCLNAKNVKDFATYLKEKKLDVFKHATRVVDDLDEMDDAVYGFGSNNWSH